ncbi:uncharacterized mitochondrial protein AtMg00810-like [Cornus florida]|uniref:uncharacterized mitochondrial protein AtMg00810-like n=1 Tax=Cornus florida TaxID=4283 RepID=UPI0028A0EC49|nr:uncharacterized mitochondrial protein AtMg00810-like [Cornus florida]
MTRPDIAYAVSVVSQFMHSPCAPHLDSAIRILRYLKVCPGRGILFANHGHLRVEAWTDADYAGSNSDRGSTSGYCTTIGGNLVTWHSKKQDVVSRSSAEAEYRAMAFGVELGAEPQKFPLMVKYGMTIDKNSTFDASPSPGQISHGGHGGSENLALPITGQKLNGHNYLQCAQSVMMFISGKEKDDYLTGAAIPPQKEDPKF